MDKQQFKTLLSKYEAGTCTDEEKALLETWYLGWEPEHRPHMTEELVEESVDRIWERLQVIVQPQLSAGRGKAGPARFYLQIAAAASIALIAFFSFWWARNEFRFAPSVRLVSVHADAGPHKTILPDGSIIWLKPGAALEYPVPFGTTRRISLQGEALFEVAKDPEHPFVVSVGDYTATVLGTSFYIRQSDNRRDMELAVLTGKVKIGQKDRTPSFEERVLLPDQKISTSSPRQIRKVTKEESAQYISGTGYNMNFKNMPFDRVIALIERKFDVTVKVRPERYASCRFTADLTDQGLDHTLKFIATSAGASYEVKENIVLIKGGGCK